MSLEDVVEEPSDEGLSPADVPTVGEDSGSEGAPDAGDENGLAAERHQAARGAAGEAHLGLDVGYFPEGNENSFKEEKILSSTRLASLEASIPRSPEWASINDTPIEGEESDRREKSSEAKPQKEPGLKATSIGT